LRDAADSIPEKEWRLCPNDPTDNRTNRRVAEAQRGARNRIVACECLEADGQRWRALPGVDGMSPLNHK
jgi:hypothetical protein